MVSNLASLQPTTRFSNRVENYVKYRPSYPAAIIPFLEKELGLTKEKHIADIGSGTGLFAEPLLKSGFRVTCVEPNEEMRLMGEEKLGSYPGFTAVSHRAEETGLPDESIDLITVAQAFHWMDPISTKKEFLRILRPGGHIVLAWNRRRKDDPFLKAYNELKARYATEPMMSESVSGPDIVSFFAPRVMGEKVFENIQHLDFDSLKGQLLSSSYIPLPGHTDYDEMISRLVQLFVQFNENGVVKMAFDTRVYFTI